MLNRPAWKSAFIQPGSCASGGGRLSNVSFRAHLSDEWTVHAVLTDQAGETRLPLVRFWSRAVLHGEQWHLNTNLDVLELTGLFDDWEQRCLLEAADFVAPVVAYSLQASRGR